MNKQKIGVIIANLGTPDEPTPKAVHRYLKQFLSDPRVVDLPRWKWLPILNFMILPKRSKHVAETYKQVWTEQGSPLMVISRQQQQDLQTYLEQNHPQQQFQVELAMTYGNPSFQTALQNLNQFGAEKIIVLPLYPQYSSSTTAAVFDAFADALKQQKGMLPFEFIHSYHLDPNYIDGIVATLAKIDFTQQYLLFSFHGIPLSYDQQGDYYRQHCQQTAQAIANKLGLTPEQWKLTFQSRFGKEEWLQPYTDEFLQNAAKQGIEQITVVCPGFSADCIETLEEIDEENREYFLHNGGKNFEYIPALNARPEHIKMMAELILKKL